MRLPLTATAWEMVPNIPHAAYAPDTDPAVLLSTPDVHWVGQTDDDQLFASFQFADTNRWSSTATNGGGLRQGDPTTVTWSIIPDGTMINGFNGEPSSPSNLVAFLGSIYGTTTANHDYTDEPWFGLFQNYLQRWSQLSGIQFVYEANDDGAALTSFSQPGQLGVRGDMRIAGHYIDGQSNILAYNFFPNGGDMVIDTGDSNFFGNTTNNSRALRNVLAHENGHGLGLSHVCPVTSGLSGRLMEPFINLSIDGPQFDDILAVHRGYGDVLEKSGGNDSPLTATTLGTLTSGQTLRRGTDANDVRVAPGEADFVSIDDDSDVDYFSFTVGAGLEASIVLTPLGPSYLSGSQNSNGSCSSGTLFDSAAQSDLSMQLIGSDGSTVLRTANAGGLGQSETISSGILAAGTYYIRVTGTANAAQMYQLSLSGTQLASVVIEESAAQSLVSENGLVDSYSLRLATTPTGPVQVTATADAQSRLSADGVNFSSSVSVSMNSSSPRTLWIRAVDDSVSEGNHLSSINHAITASSDLLNYPLSAAIPSVTVEIHDNDLAEFERTEMPGSLISTSVNNTGSLASASDSYDLTVPLLAGQTLALNATPDAGVLLSLQLVEITNKVTASTGGETVRLPATAITSDGIVTIRVTSSGKTNFTLDGLLNAAQEGTDSGPQNPLNIGGSQLSLFPSGQRWGVAGTATPSTNPLQFNARNAPELFVDISATGTPLNLADDAIKVINTTLGNSVFPAGAVSVSNNGVMALGKNPQIDYANTNLPSTRFGTALLPFWDDLDDSTGNVYWEQRSIGGIPALIVQWENRPHYNNVGNATFQAQVFASGPTLIRYAYEDVNFGSAAYNGGASATVGYQSSSNSAVLHSFQQATLSGGMVLELAAPVTADTDIYTLDLSSFVGQQVDVALSGIAADFSSQSLELLAPDGFTVLASGVATPLPSGSKATNSDLAIRNFVVPAAGTYGLRVSSQQAGKYTLVVTAGLSLEIEPNNTIPVGDSNQLLQFNRPVIGYLDYLLDADDVYQVELQQGQAVRLRTTTPFDAPIAVPGNSLNPELSVVHPNGSTLIASDQNSAGDNKNAFVEFITPIDGRYTIHVQATGGAGEYGIELQQPLQVTDVFVNSTSWAPLFRDFIDGGFNDGPSLGALDDGFARGYRIQGDESLPWMSLDQIKIQFGGNVGASLSVTDFLLSGDSGYDQNFAPGVVPAISGVSFDSSNNVATLQLHTDLGPNRYQLKVLSAGIQSPDGDTLVADQTLEFHVLPGDTIDNHASSSDVYIVNGPDVNYARDRQAGFIFDALGTNAFDGAFFNYDPRADINGDGQILGPDVNATRDRQSSFVFVIVPSPTFAVSTPDNEEPEALINGGEPETLTGAGETLLPADEVWDSYSDELADSFVAPANSSNYAGEVDDYVARLEEDLLAT